MGSDKIDEQVTVGVLHSLTGPMAASEAPIVDAILLAIEEINEQGGLLGRPVVADVRDGASDSAAFARHAEEHFADVGIDTLFGCWTSSSRKRVKPIVERVGGLLFYPAPYEGFEESPHIFYGGACLNQQVIPAIDWLRKECGPRIFFVGSDYVYPRIASRMGMAALIARGGEPVGEIYLPLDAADVASAVDAVEAARPDAIFCAINGDAAIPFAHELLRRGFGPDHLPVISVSQGETELDRMGAAGVGRYACWGFFDNPETDDERSFPAMYRRRYGPDRLVTDPILTGYRQVMLWREGVEQAGSLDPKSLIATLPTVRINIPGGLVGYEENHHKIRPALIGRWRADRRFETVWRSDGLLAPTPWLGGERLQGSDAPLLMEALGSYPEGVHRLSQMADDIAARKKVEAALVESERHYRTLFLNMLNGFALHTIVMNDAGEPVDYIFEEVNDAFCAMTGQTRDHLIGKRVTEVFPGIEKDTAEWIKRYGAVALSGEGVRFEDYSDTLQGYFSVFAYAPRIGTFATVVEDVTDRVRISRREEELNRERKYFTAVTSHELRTPLAHLQLAALLMEEMEQRYPDEPAIEKVRAIVKDSFARIDSVVAATTLLAELQGEEKASLRRPVSLQAMVASTVDIVRTRMHDARRQLTLTLDLGGLCRRDTVLCDPGRMERALLEVVINAVRYTPDGGTIRVEGRRDDQQATLSIVDSGVGMTPEEQANLARVFYSPRDPNRHYSSDLGFMGGGLGLGLCLTRYIIDETGGVFAIESPGLGQGTEVTITLPIGLGG